MIKNLYVSGYRSYEMGIFSDEDERLVIIKQAIRSRLEDDWERGLEWVLISGQLGAELWTGQVVLEMKNEGMNLKLGMVIPYLDFESSWNEKNQALFYQVKEGADYVNYSSKKTYDNPGQLQANQVFLIRSSQKALLLYDTEYKGKCQYAYDLIQKRQNQSTYALDLITVFDLRDQLEQERLRNQDDFF